MGAGKEESHPVWRLVVLNRHQRETEGKGLSGARLVPVMAGGKKSKMSNKMGFMQAGGSYEEVTKKDILKGRYPDLRLVKATLLAV